MNTILFDLDGTLLPMNQEDFTKAYFSLLAQKCAPHGYAPEVLVDAVWAGTKAMVKNNGEVTNEQLFWDSFSKILGDDVLRLRPELERFYSEEFNGAQAATRPNPAALALLQRLAAAGYDIVLATNPLFPLRAVHTRLSWLGIPPDMFAHITSYETCHYCKPNPQYYREILETIQKAPEDCVMIGNDAHEDGCAAGLGMDFYLVTDDLINTKQLDLSAHKQGSFQQCCDWLATATN